MSSQILEKISKAIIELNEEEAVSQSREALSSGINPLEIINIGIRGALDVIGEKFQRGEAFLPELMIAAKATEAAIAVIEPELIKRGSQIASSAKVLMTTVKGDIHDIGKNIVILLMKSAGFQVYDLGVDQATEAIVEKAKEIKADVIGLSAVLTTTMPKMKELVDTLVEEGIRDRFKVIIGGAPVSQEFADYIGADGYGPDAARGVELVRTLTKRSS